MGGTKDVPPKPPKDREAWLGVVVGGDKTQAVQEGIKGEGTLMGGALVEAGLYGACFSAAAVPPTP